MQITPNHAFLTWLAAEDVMPSLWPKLLGMLDGAELEHANHFKFAHDRDDYIMSHALTRGTLALLTGRLPSDWTFETDIYGKPELVCDEGTSPIRVNSTHTRGFAAVAVILNHDIGCDAERLSLDAPLNIADDYFTRAECADLRTMYGTAASERFYTLWTLKEAYLKAVGQGLNLALNAASFRFDPLTVSFSTQVSHQPVEWYFDHYSPGPEHILALAIQHPTPSVLTVKAGAVELQEMLATLGKRP